MNPSNTSVIVSGGCNIIFSCVTSTLENASNIAWLNDRLKMTNPVRVLIIVVHIHHFVPY